MSSVRRLGLMLLVACAFSAVAVASASAAPLFLAHPPGALLLASAADSIKFSNASGTFECTRLKLLPPGDATVALRATSLLLVVDYEKCTVFGLNLHFHPVQYQISANGLIRQENTILALGPQGCLLTFPAASNQSLWTVKIENNLSNGGLLLLLGITKIASEGAGGAGGICAYAPESNGTLQATIHVKAEGGVIRWDS
jgi:hypothetical protein